MTNVWQIVLNIITIKIITDTITIQNLIQMCERMKETLTILSLRVPDF